MIPAMAAPEKFLFDTIFDEETLAREEKKKKPEGPPLVHTEQAMIDAVEQMRQTTQESAFAEGRDTGIGEVRDATDSHAAKALEAISAALPALLELRQSIIREAHKNATALALQIGTKLADEVLRTHPVDQITKMISDALDEIGGGLDQRILVHINPELMDALSPRMDDLRQRSGPTGEIVLIADGSLDGSACRVEWPEGGADRDPAEVASEIETAVYQYLNLVEDLAEFQGESSVMGQAPTVDEPGLASELEAIADPPQAAEPKPELDQQPDASGESLAEMEMPNETNPDDAPENSPASDSDAGVAPDGAEDINPEPDPVENND
jgi:flagellar assembly protein FliH